MFASSNGDSERNDDTQSQTDTDKQNDKKVSGRPSPEEIAEGFAATMEEAGLNRYAEPSVARCVGQHYYDSELSDDVLAMMARAEPVTGEHPEAKEVEEVTIGIYDACGV